MPVVHFSPIVMMFGQTLWLLPVIIIQQTEREPSWKGNVGHKETQENILPAISTAQTPSSDLIKKGVYSSPCSLVGENL